MFDGLEKKKVSTNILEGRNFVYFTTMTDWKWAIFEDVIFRNGQYLYMTLTRPLRSSKICKYPFN